MSVDIEQWRAEIRNFNGCLHYAIIKLGINLFKIMVRVSQVLALILAKMSQYVFIINKTFHLLNTFFVFVLLFIVLKFTVTNYGLCFEFNQNCHKQILYLYCLNAVTAVNVVVCGYFLHLLLLQHGDKESDRGPRNEQTNKNLSHSH